MISQYIYLLSEWDYLFGTGAYIPKGVFSSLDEARQAASKTQSYEIIKFEVGTTKQELVEEFYTND